MDGGQFWKLAGVSDLVLQGQIKQLIAAGSRTEARIVAHLAEVEARRLHLIEGRESLFEYCKKSLGLSENEAFYRIVAARLARRFPAIFELLERREVFITTLPLLRDYLTADNQTELLEAVRGKSKQQVLELLAARAPRPDARSNIRRLATTPRSVAAGPTGTLEPLSAESYRLQLNTSQALKAKLELARDLMSHANPGGDLAVVIERGLDLLIVELQKRRFGQASRPRQGKATNAVPGDEQPSSTSPSEARVTVAGLSDEAGSHFDRSKSGARVPNERHRESGSSGCQERRREHIPQQLRREIVARDGLQCTFTSPHGQGCEARAFLEIHHEQPWARGGSDQLDNLRVLCASHNALLADQAFGVAHVQLKIAETRRRAG